MGIPLLDLRARDAPTPTPDGGGDVFGAPADVDAEHVAEQFGRGLPLVATELPRLARGEDGHDAAPIVGFELLRGVNEDEAKGSCGVDGWEEPRDV